MIFVFETLLFFLLQKDKDIASTVSNNKEKSCQLCNKKGKTTFFHFHSLLLHTISKRHVIPLPKCRLKNMFVCQRMSKPSQKKERETEEEDTASSVENVQESEQVSTTTNDPEDSRQKQTQCVLLGLHYLVSSEQGGHEPTSNSRKVFLLFQKEQHVTGFFPK